MAPPVESLRATDDPNKQGVKFDDGKTRYDLVPVELTEAVALILGDGAKKYGDRNWEKGMAWSRPFGALLRHLFAWWWDSPSVFGSHHAQIGRRCGGRIRICIKRDS